MQYDISTHSSYSLVSFQEDILEQSTVLEMATLVQDLLKQGPPNLIFDLGCVEYIDSLISGTFISAHMHCRKRGGQFVLAEAGPRIRKIAILAAAGALSLADSVEDAVRSLE